MISRRLVLDDGRAKRDVPLTATVVVGRDPSCQVSDPDPLLSRRHAEFVPTATSVTIRDLGSRNGILVNGDKVPERVLAPGDLVQAGRLQFLYVEEIVAAPPPPAAPPPEPPVPAATMVLPDLSLPADFFEQPVLKPLPTGDEPTFIPEGWRAAAAAIAPALDDTVPSLKPPSEDPDATRFVGFRLPDLDATGAFSQAGIEAAARNDDETMLNFRMPAGAPLAPLAPGEARIVAGPSLVVIEASAAGDDLFGLSPQSLVGASVPDLVVRALGMMIAGEGPAAVSLRAERRHAGGLVTITFTTDSTTGK